MNVIHQFNAQFLATLAQIFTVGAHPDMGPVQFPVYPDIPAYPPSDLPDEDDIVDDLSQGSPIF